MELNEALKRLQASTCPEDIFDGAKNADDLKVAFREWAKVVHPDGKTGSKLKSATEAFQLLNERHMEAVAKIFAGTYGNRLAMKKVVLTTKKTSYTLTEQLPPGDLCNVYAGEDEDGKKIIAKVTRHPANNDLIVNEQEIMHWLHNESKTRKLKAMCHIPILLDSFEIQQGPKRKRVNIFHRHMDYYSFADILRLCPKGIDLRDAAWMFNRLLGALCIPHQANVVHGAVVPTHIIVHGEKHNGVLVDWCYAQRNNKPLKAVVPAYKDFYPPEALDKKPTHRNTDVYMAAKCLVALLGENWKTCPRNVQGVIKACLLGPKHRTKDVFALHKEFGEALKENFGPRRYRKYVLPTV